jgi:hypothetical protein
VSELFGTDVGLNALQWHLLPLEGRFFRFLLKQPFRRREQHLRTGYAFCAPIRTSCTDIKLGA